METPQSRCVPEKPALEGLEDEVAGALGTRTAPLSSTARSHATRSIRSTRRRRRSADRCTSATCSPTPTPTSSRASSGCVAGSVLSDGVGRQRTADRATRAELLRRAMRSVAAVRFGLSAAAQPPKQPISISRPNFIELCERLTKEDEKAFEHLWRYLGLSVDWSMTYATIDKRSQRVSQIGFLHLLKKGLAYQLEAPTLWDVDFRTAVAQAELEDREREGAYHRLRFDRPDGGAVEIETTRPELLPACVALVAHPDDERYRPLFGKDVLTPLFRARVPVMAHALADPEKGSGIAMICTFGDITDVTWWRELSLPVRAVIQPNGTLRPVTWGEQRMGIAGPGGCAAGVRPDVRAVDQQGARQGRRASARAGRDDRRAAADHAQREVLREGRSPARNRHEPPVVHQDAGLPIGAHRTRTPAAVASRIHARPLRELGERVERRLVRQPPAVLRRAVPDLVSDRQRRRGGLFAADRSRRVAAANRSVDRCARWLSRRPARSAERIHRRSGRHGHMGDLVADAADRQRLVPRRRSASSACSRWISGRRRTTSSGPGCFRRCCARISSTTVFRGLTRRSRASSPIPIARRCRSRRATS